MQNKNSAFGKNNFDRLEAAGLVAGEDNSASVKAKTQARIEELKVLATKIEKVQAGLQDLYILSKPARLKKLSAVIAAVKKLHESALPVGSKKHVAHCLNELVSLRENVYASNAVVDKKHLTLIASAAAKTEVLTLVASAEAKLDKIMADSSHSDDLDEFYRKAAEVVQKHAGESTKLAPIKDKPFVIARVPVVPADGILSGEKLARLGFSTENLGGYTVIHNQIVIGINPKTLLSFGKSDDFKVSTIKGERVAEAVREELDRLRRKLQKTTKVKLQLVSDKAYSYGSGTWFWLMSDRDLDMLARAFPGNHIKIGRWGFAFN